MCSLRDLYVLATRIKKMNELDEIDNIVNGILEKSDYLLRLSRNDDAEIRMRAIEAINKSRNFYEVRDRLFEGLNDVDELVRIECLEFIGDTRDIYFVSDVEKLLNDEAWLVRGVAAVVLSKIGNDAPKKIIESKIYGTDNDEELIRYYLSLAIYGHDEYVEKVFSLLYTSSNYRLKCSIVNMLEDCIDFLDQQKVLMSLQKALDEENDEVVRSSLLSAVESISEEF
jgi:HEAT repeat protein